METLNFINGLKLKCSYRCKEHSHKYIEIVYHISGEGTTKISSGEEFAFNKDSVIIYKSNVGHSQTMSSSGEDACILLENKQPLKFPGDHNCICINYLTNNYLRNEIMKLAELGNGNTGSPEQRFSNNLRATALLNDLFCIFRNSTTGKEQSKFDKINEAHEYIIQNFRQLESLQEVAEYVGLSYHYLRHQFKQIYNISMIDFLICTKLEYAKHLLKNTPLIHAQIAKECGFSNARYFNAAFKKATGRTPGRFRMEMYKK